LDPKTSKIKEIQHPFSKLKNWGKRETEVEYQVTYEIVPVEM